MKEAREVRESYKQKESELVDEEVKVEDEQPLDSSKYQALLDRIKD